MHTYKRLVVLADTHFGKRTQFGGETERIDELSRCLRAVLTKVGLGGTAVVFAGDFLDKRNAVDPITACAVMDFLRKLSGVDVFLLGGNHEYRSDGANFLYMFSGPRCYVLVDESYGVVVGDKDYLLAPYTPEMEYVTGNEQEFYGVITHCMVKGASVNGVTMDTGISPTIFNRFKLALLGDVHSGSRVGNVQYIGSPYQMTFGEAGNTGRIAIIDSDSCKMLSLDGKFPKYWVVDSPSDVQGNPLVDYYSLRMSPLLAKQFIEENELVYYRIEPPVEDRPAIMSRYVEGDTRSLQDYTRVYLKKFVTAPSPVKKAVYQSFMKRLGEHA